jgi:ribonuclease P/MRP protein subunit POP5
MVRVKHRYLVVNILYPELEKGQRGIQVPDIVTFHQPTTDALDSRALLKGLRDSASNLFGDYGSGAISGSLSGRQLFLYVISLLGNQ